MIAEAPDAAGCEEFQAFLQDFQHCLFGSLTRMLLEPVTKILKCVWRMRHLRALVSLCACATRMQDNSSSAEVIININVTNIVIVIFKNSN